MTSLRYVIHNRKSRKSWTPEKRVEEDHSSSPTIGPVERSYKATGAKEAKEGCAKGIGGANGGVGAPKWRKGAACTVESIDRA